MGQSAARCAFRQADPFVVPGTRLRAKRQIAQAENWNYLTIVVGVATYKFCFCLPPRTGCAQSVDSSHYHMAAPVSDGRLTQRD